MACTYLQIRGYHVRCLCRHAFPPGREPAALITQLEVLLSAKGLPGQVNATGAVPVNVKALVERAMGSPGSRSRSSSAAGAARLTHVAEAHSSWIYVGYLSVPTLPKSIASTDH